MPNRKIINLDNARNRNHEPQPDLYGLLTRLDELEDALETMDELGLTTRDELAALIDRLEVEADRLDHEPKGE